ncbi:MAG: hypothetical protein ACLFSB_04145 [Chitinispirillaceae bacterium]
MDNKVNRWLIPLLALVQIVAAQEMQGVRTRIGILPPQIRGEEKKLQERVLGGLETELTEVGVYEIFTPDKISRGLEEIHQKMPVRCGEPRCAAAIGSALQMDRMIYGSVDKNPKSWGIRLYLLDVNSRQLIENVSIEGGPGVELEEVLSVAVGKLHGRQESTRGIDVKTYYGQEVHNEKQLYISAPVVIGAGLLWGLVSGALTGRDENDNTPQYDRTDFSEDQDSLFGIGAETDQIALFGRPGALANAYVAASDDAYGVFFNPAGLSWIRGGEVQVGYQYRYGIDNIAASFVNKATREIGFGQGMYYSGDELLSEMYFISAISYKVNELVSWLHPFSLGAAVKLNNQSFAGSSPDASTGNAFGAALDLGFLWQINDQIRYGLMVRNVPAVMYNTNTAHDTSYIEMRPATMHMGGTFQANHATFLICEGDIPLNDDQPWGFAGGIERILFGGFALRIGIQKEADFQTPWIFTGGFGLDVDTHSFLGENIALDGSYEYNTLDMFAHVVNISLRFGF